MTPPLHTHTDDSSLSTTLNHVIADVRLLRLLQTAWVLYLVYKLVLLVILIPANLSIEVFGVYGGYPELQSLGLIPFFSYAGVAVKSMGLLVSLLVSAILMWRGNNDTRTILFAFVTLTYLGAITLPSELPPLLGRPASLFNIFGLMTILYIFPSDRFKYRWQLYWFSLILMVLAVYHLYSDVIDGPIGLFFFAAALIGIGSFIDRYRTAPVVQRQQIKWLLPVLIGLGLVFTGLIIVIIFLPPTPPRYVLQYGLILLSDVGYAGIALAVALAVMRYRLYEVDVIVNRSLVYGAVTVLLIMVFSTVIGLVSVVTQGTGTGLGALMATGAAGLLFNPARKTIQTLVDHRLYGLRYDLNQVAAAQQKPEIKNPGAFTGRIFGKYELLGVLGKGGMGEVYKAFGEGQTVAVKLLPTELARHEEFRKRFQREVETLSKLNHPNIVRLFEGGQTEQGEHYLAMEWINGRELTEVTMPVDPLDLHDWLTGIAAALDYIHTHGLVHRDLKPSNIMLRKSADGETEQAVLMDFGIARSDYAGTRLTGSGAVGTIDYMAPEQIMAAREVDHRADIYALGVIVYELLTGERPFKGGVGQVVFAHLQQPAPDPRDVNADVPRYMAKAIQKALEKDPNERFASTEEFMAALQLE